MQNRDDKTNFLSNDWDSTEKELDEIDRFQTLKIEINEGLEEALQGLENLQSQLPKEQSKNLLQLCRDNVIETINGQFGLASLIIDSRKGGAVTTTHNFEKGFIDPKSKDDMQRYKSYQKSQSDSWQEVRKRSGYDEPLPQMRKKAFQTKDVIIDEYTGRILPKDGRAHIDHIVSAKEIESTAKAHLGLSVEERAKLATNKENLAWTDSSINQSKGDKKMKDFLKTKDKKTGQTKAEKYNIDEQKAMQRDKEARKCITRSIDKAVFKKQAKELIATGAKDATKMVAYSAIGIVLRELVQGIIQELQTILSNDKKESLKEIFNRFKKRLQEIWANLRSKWKDIFAGSLEAGILAFFSNIVVFVINMFASTLKRIVKIIRAGFVSLYQAIKILVNPPKDMPKEEVGYAALKVLTAGLIGALSLGLTEGIAELLSKIPPLAAILGLPIPIVGGTLGDAISITLSAIVGGLLTTIALYYMDKWRSQSKEDRLQIQIMTKSGEIVQYKIAQTWFVLKDGYQAVMSIANHTQESLLKTQSIITQSGLEAKNALDETDVKIAELKRLFNS